MLVVIGIISVLVTMGFASYSTVQKSRGTPKDKGFESSPASDGAVLFYQQFSVSRLHYAQRRQI